MRLRFAQWKETLSRLGLRLPKKPAPRPVPSHPLQIERLEDRNMMAVATIAATDATADELSQATGTFTITLDSPASGNVTVNIALSGTASGSDFAESSSTTVVVLDSETTATLAITPELDNLVESGETVICTIVSGTGYTIGTADNDTVTISDDPPIVSIAVNDDSVTENTTGSTITVSRTGGDITQALVVQLGFDGTADPVDDLSCALGQPPTEITIPANESGETFYVEPIADNLVEGTETAVFEIDVDAGHYVIDEESVEIDFIDDPPVVTISLSASSMVEGATGITVAVSRTGGDITQAIVVQLDYSGTADPENDFDCALGQPPTEITIPANESEATFVVEASPDNLVEGTQTAVFEILPDTELYAIDEDTASIDFIDDPPVVTISVSAGFVDEGDSGITVTVSRTGGDITQALLVLLDYGGTAEPGDDFTSSLGFPITEITIPANESEANFTFDVGPDNLVEGTETAVFEILADSEHYTIDEESVEINFGDDAPLLTIYVVNGLASEDAAYSDNLGWFIVERSGGDLTQPLEFTFTFGADLDVSQVPFYALPGEDFEAPFSYTATFDAYDESWDFLVIPIDDELIERNEWVTLEIIPDAEHFVVAAGPPANIAIDDDERWGNEDTSCVCLCGCEGVSTGVVEKDGSFVAEAADGHLRYKSSTNDWVVVSVPVPFEYSAAQRETILARLTFADLDPVEVNYDPTGLTLYTDYLFAVPVDAHTLATGRYAWTMQITETFDGASNRVRTYSGNQEINNLSESIYGSGWSVTAVDRLAIQDDGVSWVQGGGTQIWFDDNLDGSFDTQQGDPNFSVLTYADDVYTLVTRSGETLQFDENGLLQTRSDRFSNSFTYAYIDADSDSETDDIETITSPTGEELSLSYTAGFLSGITDYVGRFLSVEIVGGELLSVTGPDSNGETEGGTVAVSEFTYADGLMASFTLPSASATDLVFDHAGGLASRTNASDDTRYFTNEITGGVVDTTGGYGGELDPAELVLASSVVGSQTNELDETVTYRTDTYGGRLSETNDLNQTTQYLRNADGQVTQIVGPAASGGVDFRPIQILTYEDGNLSQVLNFEGVAFGRITEYEYDETWTDVVVSIMTYAGGASPSEPLSWTLFTLDEATGAVLETRRVQGEVDDEINEETDDLVETFTYTAAPSVSGDPPAGLLASYTNPNGIITLYDYSERGLVVEITLAFGTADEATLGFEYDSADNLTAEVDELGRRTEHTYNDVGNRLTSTLPDPDGAGPLAAPELSWEYNIMGRVTLAVDPLGRETEYVYGAFGNLMSQTLSGAGFDPVTLSWTYDDAGRNISSTDGLGRTTSTTLDVLGRVLTTTLPDPDSGGELTAPTFSQTYSSLGSVATTTDALDNVTSIEVSDYGRTVTTTLADPDGAGPLESPIYVQHFDVLGRLIEEVGPTGGVTTYSYNMLSQLVEKVLPDPDGAGPLESPVFTWTYDAAGNMLTATDANGATTAYVSDARGRMVELHLPDAETGEPVETASFTWVFDAAGQLLSETDALGRVTQHEYDALGRETALILNDPDGAGPLASPEYHYSFDAASRLILEVAPNGGETEYEYDLLDNVVLLRLPDPDGEGGASRPEYTYVFDAASQLLSETDPLGRTTLHTLDNLGREIETETEDPDGAGPLEPSFWQFQFDAMSNLVLTVDPLANETAYQFDNLHRRTKIVDALSGETSFSFDAASNLLSLTDPVSNTTSWTYDTLNRVVEEENELGASRYFRYDAMSTLIEKTDRNNRVTAYVPDKRGRIVQENWRPGVTLAVETTTEGSQANEVQRVGFSDTTELTGGTFTLTFDSETTDPLAFDADATTVQAALEALTTIGSGNISVSKTQNASTDQEWQLTFQGTLAAANQSQTTISSTSVTHTGTLTDIQATDAQGASVDEVQVVTLENAETGTFTLTFDSEITDPIALDASAETVELALADLTSIGSGNVSVSGSAGGPWTVTFGGALEGTNVAELIGDKKNLASTTILRSFDFEFDEANQLLSAVDPDATFGFVYDGLGRTTSTTADLAGFTSSIVMAQAFDAMNSRTQLAASIGAEDDFVNDYTFDGLSRMTRIERHGQVGGNAVAETRIDLAYNGVGQFTSIDRYADLAGEDFVLSTAYAYDGMGRLSTLDHAQGVTALAGYAFTYDAASRITEIDSLVDGLTTYNYDNTSQLIGADFATQTDETHEWDANGNPDESNFDIGPNNQILTDGTFDYAYDAEGNLILKTTIATGETVSFIWDHRNRLTDVVNRDEEEITQSVHYAYDFLNRWTYRELDADGSGEASAADTWYAYDGYQIVLSFDDDAATAPDRRYLTGPLVDQILTDETDTNEARHLLGDHLNTVRDVALLDLLTGDTAVENHITYSSFNAKLADTDAAFATLFGETGRPYDEATKNNNHGHRWLASWLRRWLNEDPIQFSGDGSNLIRMVGNNPIMYLDPTGESETLPAAEGRVAGEAIKEKLRNAGAKTEQPVTRTTPSGKTPGRVDAVVKGKACEIGPASPTGVAAKANQLKSVGKGDAILYRQRNTIPKAGDVVEYVKLNYAKVEALAKAAKDKSLTAKQVWEIAKKNAPVLKAQVSAKASEAAGRIFLRGKQFLRTSGSAARCNGLPLIDTLFEGIDYIRDPYEFERKWYMEGGLIFPGMLIPPGMGNGGMFYTPSEADREWARMA